MNAGTETDLRKAKEYAQSEGYQVFTYPTDEPDPLEKARQAVVANKEKSL